MKNNKNSFALDVFTLMTAPIIAQVISIFLTPVLTRLYTPEAFGLANLLSSFVMLFASFATLGYHNAIILPKNDFYAKVLFRLCLVLILTTSLLSIIIIVFGKKQILLLINSPEIVKFLWLVPIFVFSEGLYETLRFWSTRFRDFKKIAISRTIPSFSQRAYQITTGIICNATADNLIYGNLFSRIIKNLVFLQKVETEDIKKTVKISHLVVTAKRYIKFPKFSLWGNLLAKAPYFIIPFLIVKFFDQRILGYYSLGQMVITLPIVFFTSSISEALMPRLAIARREGKHVSLIIKVYERLFSFTVFPFFILTIFGELIFSIIFGLEWNTAGVYAQILSIGAFASIVFSTTYPIIITMEKQEIIPINKVSFLLIVISSFCLGGFYQNIYISLVMLTVLEFILATVVGLYLLGSIGVSFYDLFNKVKIYISVIIMLFLVLFFLRLWIYKSTLFFISYTIISGFVYYSLLLYKDKEIGYLIKMLLKKS